MAIEGHKTKPSHYKMADLTQLQAPAAVVIKVAAARAGLTPAWLLHFSDPGAAIGRNGKRVPVLL